MFGKKTYIKYNMHFADFDKAYSTPPELKPLCGQFRPPCDAPTCFIGSYPPVTPAGEMGDFFVNTYFLRPDRRSEIPGPVPVRKLC